MKSILLLLGLLRSTLIQCGLVIAFVTLLIVGGFIWHVRLEYRHNTLKSDHQQLLRDIQIADTKIQMMTQAQVFLDRGMHAGLVGPARREEWVQSLIKAHERLGLQGIPSFKLSKPERLPELATLAMGTEANNDMLSPSMHEMSGTTLEVYSHLLEFKLQDVHEGEVLSILSSLRSEYPDIQRPLGCRLIDPQPTGLTAECRIRFFNILLSSEQAITPAQPTLPMNGKL